MVRKSVVIKEPLGNQTQSEETPKPVKNTRVSRKKQVVDDVKSEPCVDPKPSKSNKSKLIQENLQREYQNLISLIEGKVSVSVLKKVQSKIKKIQGITLRNLKKPRKTNPHTGFNKPCEITKELSQFLGFKTNELVSRTHVTKQLTKYIKENNLENPDNRMHINPDETLKKLLKYDETKKPLTYCTLQIYIQPHYVKKKKSK